MSCNKLGIYFMTAIVANIIRPQMDANFTALPNTLLDFGRHVDLKPRDVTILNYLLSKPAQWKLRARDIANGTNISEGTVRAGLKVLQKLGFASYTREKTGVTNWEIKVPEYLVSPATKPYIKKPHVVKPHVENAHVILKNEIPLTKNEKTTNSVVVESVAEQKPIDYINEPTPEIVATPVEEIAPVITTPDVVEFDINELQPVEKKSVEKILSKIEPTAQTAVIGVFKSALKKGTVKSPVAYAAMLVKKSQSGELNVPTVEEKVNAPIGANDEKEKRADKIRRVFAKHSEKIKQQLITEGHIIIDNDTVTKSEFEELGLVEKGARTISGGRNVPYSEMLEMAKQEPETEQPKRRASTLDNVPHDMSEIAPKPLTEKEIAARQKIIELEMQLRASGQWVEPNLVEMAF